MITNAANEKLIHPELSYLVTGIFFSVHNQLGRFARERQYAEELERHLKASGLTYQREFEIRGTGNRVDFLIDEKIIAELKAKPLITKDDSYQMQRYLQVTGLKLGLLVNFRNRYLRPARIIRIETDQRSKFV